MQEEKKLPPGALLEKVLEALAGAPPLGLDSGKVAALIGRSHGTAKTTLWRLEKRKQCWRISVPGYAAAYFPTEAACEAARSEVEERFAKIGRERHEAARLRQRARDRARTGRPADAPDQPDELTCSEFLAGYLKSMLPEGISLAQATEASGKSYHSVKKSMGRMVLIGEQAWSIARPGGRSVYFGSKEARDAAAAAQEAKPAPKPERAKKPPKRPKEERQPRYEFRRSDLDAPPPKKEKQPVSIDTSRAKITRQATNPALLNRWHVDGPVIGGFRTMGIGRYLQDHPALVRNE